MDSSSQRPDLFSIRAPHRVLGLGLGIFGASYFTALIIAAALQDIPPHLLSLGVSTIGMVGLPLWYLRRRHVSIPGSLRLHALRPSQSMWVAGMVIAIVPPMLALAAWNQTLVPPPPEYVAFVEGLRPESTLDWTLSILTVVILGPLGEEIVFRGLIHHAARFVFGRVLAILFTALVFALAHGQPWNLASLVLMGLLLSLVFEATGSLVAPLVLHALYNLTLLLIQVYGTTVPDLPTEATAFGAICSLAVAWGAYGRLRCESPWPAGEIDRD